MAPTAAIEICYGVHGTTTVGNVAIAREAEVVDLQVAIFNQERVAAVNRLTRRDLRLFIPQRPVRGDTRLYVGALAEAFLKQSEIPSDFKQLESISQLIDLATLPNQIHVLVQLHDRACPPAKHTGVEEAPGIVQPTSLARSVDGTNDWLKRFHASCVASDALPSLDVLSDWVTTPLPHKVRVTRSMYSDLVSQVDQAAIDTMFVVDEGAPCRKHWNKAFRNVLYRLTGVGTTATAFYGFWDSFLRQPIRKLFPNRGATNRFKQHAPSGGSHRPSMMFTLDEISVFRGQEEAPFVGVEVAAQALREQCVWIYGTNVPYIFGYAASGFRCVLYALYYSSEAHRVGTLPLGTHQTDNAAGRFHCLLALLQCSRLFDGVVRLCPAAAKREFADVVCENGVVLESLEIPHMDRLVHVSRCGMLLTFRPRGLETQPSSLAELFVALECILTGLVYRDSTPAWFLIDLCDAAHGTQTYPNGTHLSRHEHAPGIFVEGGLHTTAVDLWSVGNLISDWDWQSAWEVDVDRARFMRHLRCDDSTKRRTAAEALAALKELRCAGN